MLLWPALHLLYLSELIQAAIQKTWFVYRIVSWILIRRLADFLKAITKISIMTEISVFKGLTILLDKRNRTLLSLIFNIYFILTYHTNFYLHNTWEFMKYYQAYLLFHFVFKIDSNQHPAVVEDQTYFVISYNQFLGI